MDVPPTSIFNNRPDMLMKDWRFKYRVGTGPHGPVGCQCFTDMHARSVQTVEKGSTGAKPNTNSFWLAIVCSSFNELL